MLNPYIDAWELRELVLAKEVRPREVAEFFLERIERLNPKLGAFMTVTAERALEDAARLENMTDAEKAALPLFGVAYWLKDLTWSKGIRTTLGSKTYENFVPHADNEYAAHIRDAGGILLGKTTTPELGGRPTTEGGLCPPARNPWNLEHTAGGSGGRAACAAAFALRPLAGGSAGDGTGAEGGPADGACGRAGEARPGGSVAWGGGHHHHRRHQLDSDGARGADGSSCARVMGAGQEREGGRLPQCGRADA